MAALEAGADWSGLGPACHPAALVQHRAADGHPAFLLAWRAAGQRPFDADDLHVLRVLGELLARLLAYAERHQAAARLARTEPLTGLLNRRGFLEELHRRLARLDRRAEPGALLFADVDNLKPLNDRHGHEAGDAALVAVAAALRAATRAGDLLGRIGGDEFVAWLDSTDGPAAESRAAAISRALATAMERRLPAEAPGATLSIGVALRPGGSPEAAEALLARADAALYAAKRAGGGAWRVAEPAP
jgi:diguanylate cyclase (GGDEF)-like protein